MVTGGSSVSPTGAGPGVMAAGAPAGCVTAVAAPTESVLPQRRSGENRRSNKPIMEKRRRARINNCLNELKTLILDAMKKDPARHSKLEKADILEMTVKHLETLQRQQVAMSAATDPSVLNKFRAGFSECAGEVGRFPGLESPVRRRLLQHLANCLNGAAASSAPASPEPPQPAAAPTTTTTTTTTALQVHILPSTADGHSAVSGSPNGIFFSTGGTPGTGLQLVPTRLPNGDIALVLPSSGPNTVFRHTVSSASASSPSTSPAPSSSSASSSPLPMLIPIPSRTSSTASASSTTSSTCSTSTSPVAFDRLTVSSPPTTSAPQQQVVCRDVATSPASYHHQQSAPASPVPQEGDGYEGYEGYEVNRPYSPPLQKPLALVMRKICPDVIDEEKPWRPW